MEAGTTVAAECHTTGANITDDVTGKSTDRWSGSRPRNGYPRMSAHYFSTIDFDDVVAGLDPC